MREFGFYKVNQEKNRVRQVTGWIVDILAAAALAVFLVSMLLNTSSVNGRSMEPSLYARDTVLVNRISPDLLPLGRYEVIEFLPEEGLTASIKRIVGLPGERIQIRDGAIYVNDALLEDSPFAGHPITIAGLAEEPVTLGEGEYFVLGDNTSSSEDSRFAGIGNVPQERIVGRVWLRVSPTSRFGPVH